MCIVCSLFYESVVKLCDVSFYYWVVFLIERRHVTAPSNELLHNYRERCLKGFLSCGFLIICRIFVGGYLQLVDSLFNFGLFVLPRPMTDIRDPHRL